MIPLVHFSLNYLRIASTKKKKKQMSSNLVFLKDNSCGMNKKPKNYK